MTSVRTKRICYRCKESSDSLYFYGVSTFICCSCNSKKVREYRQTKRGAERSNLASYKSKTKYPERHRARLILGYAVRKGVVKKPECCSKCMLPKLVEAHHEDYTEPLKVIWLCRQCHSMV